MSDPFVDNCDCDVTVMHVTEQQAEEFVDRYFYRLADGSVTSDRHAGRAADRTADRLSRMAAGYFG